MKDNYIKCPVCNKKICRIVDDSVYFNLYMWCKNCKKEIKISMKEQEPKSLKR